MSNKQLNKWGKMGRDTDLKVIVYTGLKLWKVWAIPRRYKLKGKESWGRTQWTLVIWVEEKKEHLQESLGRISQSNVPSKVALVPPQQRTTISSPWAKATLGELSGPLKETWATQWNKTPENLTEREGRQLVSFASSHLQTHFAQPQERKSG